MEVEKTHCDHCGQSLYSEYTISRGLRDALKKVARFIEVKGINIVHLQKEMVDTGWLTSNQSTNLRTHGIYTGIIAHAEEVGNYLITQKGFRFLNGEEVTKSAWVLKRTKEKGSHVIFTPDEMCNVRQFDKKGEYWEVPNFEIREGRVISK